MADTKTSTEKGTEMTGRFLAVGTVSNVLDNSLRIADGLFLSTAWGQQQITSVRISFDGPWAICGSGLDAHHFAVTASDVVFAKTA